MESWNEGEEGTMRTHSVYVVVCECGHNFETREKHTVCPECGRRIELRWGEPASESEVAPGRGK